MDIRPGQDIGPYRVLALVGEGGMGVVYKAHDPVLDRAVAIKFMRAEIMGSESARKRFLREVQTAARVHHQYVATVYSALEMDDGIGLVMEFVEGVPLSVALDDASTTTEDKVRWALQTAKALEAIHEQGIVHRDLKPSNLFVSKSRRIKVLDFGVARAGLDPGVTDAAETQTDLTVPGVIIGTPAYMSPEQTKTAPATPRSDLFSLGVILFEALTGEHPFRRETRSETIDAICRAEPGPPEARRRLDEAGPAVARLVLQLLEKDPQKRPESAAAVTATLEAIVRDTTTGADRRRSRTPWARLALAAAALVLVSAAIVLVPRFADRDAESSADVAAVSPALVFVFPPQVVGDSEATGTIAGDVIASALAESGAIRVIHPERLRATSERSEDEIVREFAEAGAYSAVWRARVQIVKEGGAQEFVARLSEGDQEPEVLRVQAPQTVAASLLLAQKIAWRVQAVDPLDASTRARGESSTSDEALLLHLEARQLSKSGDFQRAIPLLRRSLDLDPSFVRARLLLATTLDRAGYQREARDEVTNALLRIEEMKIDAGAPLAIEAQALTDRVHLRYAEAVEGYRKLAALRPGDPAVLRQLTNLLLLQNKLDEALGTISEAVAVDPLDPESLIARSEAFVRLERYDEASAAIDEAGRVYALLGVTGGQGEVALQRGYLAFRRGQQDDAIAEYTRAVEIFDRAGLTVSAAQARRSIGDMLLAKWDIKGAEQNYRAILPVAREAGHFTMVIETLRSLGMLFYRAGLYEDAERYLLEASEEAVKLGNRDFEMTVLSNLSAMLNAVGRHGEARQRADLAASIARRMQDSRRVHFATLQAAEGRAYVETGAEPIAALEALATDESAPASTRMFAWQALTKLHDVQERYDDALRACDRAMELAVAAKQPVSEGYVLALRALLLAKVGSREKAADDARRARSLLASVEQQPGLRAIGLAAALETGILQGEPARAAIGRELDARSRLGFPEYESRRLLEAMVWAADSRAAASRIAGEFDRVMAVQGLAPPHLLRAKALRLVALARAGKRATRDETLATIRELVQIELWRSAVLVARAGGLLGSEVGDLASWTESAMRRVPEEYREEAAHRLERTIAAPAR